MIDAALMAAALEISVKKCLDARPRHLDPDQSSAECDGVRVIVLACKAGRERLRHLCAAAGRIAVGGNRDPDARAADGDSALGAPVRDRLGEHRPVARIIDALVAVGAEVEDVVALCREPGRKLVLEVDAGVVGGHYDAHGLF